MITVEPGRLRREGRLYLTIGLILIVIQAAITLWHVDLQGSPAAPDGVKVMLSIIDSAMTVLLLAAPAFVTIGFIFIRLSSIGESIYGHIDDGESATSGSNSSHADGPDSDA